MTESRSTHRRLGDRLKELRLAGWDNGRIRPTQKQIADAVGVSAPSVSSWESGSQLPPESRVRALARFFATPESVHGGVGRLVAELGTEAEEGAALLEKELLALRQATAEAARAAETRDEVVRHEERSPRTPVDGRFWQFPRDATVPIRIITGDAFTQGGLESEYVNPWHPNYIRQWRNREIDAAFELYAHLRMENPWAEVRCHPGAEASRNSVTGHTVLLGAPDGLVEGAEWKPGDVAGWMLRRQELPLRVWYPAVDDVEVPPGVTLRVDAERARIAGDPRLAEDPDSAWVRDPDQTNLRRREEYRDEYLPEWVVTADADGVPAYFSPAIPLADVPRTFRYGATFLPDLTTGEVQMVQGYPQIEYDVALIARRRNELNSKTSVTLIAGLFSRGSYGAVRAFTDPGLRERNEAWLRNNVDVEDFWLLLLVPVFASADGAETVTPDLTRSMHILASSENPQLGRPGG